MPPKYRPSILENLKKEVNHCKSLLIKGLDENSGYLDTVLPLYHILIHLVLNFFISESKEVFQNLAQVSHELRLMPLPYGLLPHELIEMIDNERILPGISYLYKTGEDFPYLNHYDYNSVEQPNSEKNAKEVAGRFNWHQRVLLFEP